MKCYSASELINIGTGEDITIAEFARVVAAAVGYAGDISFDHLRHLTLYHSPNGASRGFRDKMRWIAEKAKQVGLEDVRIIDDIPMRGTGWSPLGAELWIISPEQRRLISYEEAAVAIADYSRSGTWEGELVDVGAGTAAADYEGKDVKGKIVLASGSAGSVMSEAVWKRGALGVALLLAAGTAVAQQLPDVTVARVGDSPVSLPLQVLIVMTRSRLEITAASSAKSLSSAPRSTRRIPAGGRLACAAAAPRCRL